jgi:putative flippase GtrA
MNLEQARQLAISRPMQQFLTFATIGGIATIAQYAILYTLVGIAGATPVISAIVAYLCGATTTFLLNSCITFRGRVQGFGSTTGKYLLVNAVGLAINTVVFRVGLQLGCYYLVAQAFATIIVLGWNYAGSCLLVFRK